MPQGSADGPPPLAYQMQKQELLRKAGSKAQSMASRPHATGDSNSSTDQQAQVHTSRRVFCQFTSRAAAHARLTQRLDAAQIQARAPPLQCYC